MSIKRIKETINTPEVIIDLTTSNISFSGVCAPENPDFFFNQIRHEIKNITNKTNQIIFDMELDYFNTSAFKNFMDIFMEQQKLSIASKVIWRVALDDEDLIESGELIQEVVKIPVEIIKKEIN